MISQATIDQVRERTDIVSVVGESVATLKKRGRSHVGLCPFHGEKTPSFHVNQERGFFHCFGCKESGSVIDFVMRQDGLTFPEAVRALADRLGILVEDDHGPRTDADRVKRHKDELFSVNALAATFYEAQLREHPMREHALAELARRGIDPAADVVQAFRIGYAPPAWDALAQFFREQGIAPAVAQEAGLLVPRSSGPGHYDRFRHRLMFAVIDPQARVVAFSGRALPDLEPPREDGQRTAKYINSPESPIYAKGHALFGLHQAKTHVRTAQQAILVEGNFDVVSLHARGLANVVAPLGTAFTVEQAQLLKRFAPTVVILFDADPAGRKATRAARDACKKADLVARVAVVPNGKDPDDLARDKGIDAVRAVVEASRGMLEYLLESALDETFAAADVRERAARIDEVEKLLAAENDPMVRSMAKTYADKLASRLDLMRSSELVHDGPQTDVFAALERSVRKALAAERTSPHTDAHRPRNARIATQLPGRAQRGAMVGAILDFPALLDDPEVQAANAELLEGPSAQTIAALAKALRPQGPSEIGEKALDTTAFLAQIPPAIQDFARRRLAAPQNETIEDARGEFLNNARQLRATVLSRETSDTADSIRKVEGDVETVDDLARAARMRAWMKHGVGPARSASADSANLSIAPRGRTGDGDEEP